MRLSRSSRAYILLIRPFRIYLHSDLLSLLEANADDDDEEEEKVQGTPSGAGEQNLRKWTRIARIGEGRWCVAKHRGKDKNLVKRERKLLTF